MLKADGYHVLDVGELLEARLRSAGTNPPSRAHIGPLFVARFGIDGVYDALRDVLPDEQPVVLDAIRAASTVRTLRRCHDDVFVLHVHAPEEIRTNRLRERIAGWMNPRGAEQAYAALNTDSAWCFENADAVVHNDGSPESLRLKLEDLALAPAR